MNYEKKKASKGKSESPGAFILASSETPFSYCTPEVWFQFVRIEFKK